MAPNFRGNGSYEGGSPKTRTTHHDPKRSWHIDEMNLRLHILPALGRLALDEITSERIAELISEMRPKGYAGATTNRMLALLRHIFNLAHKWNVPGAPLTPPGLASARGAGSVS